MGAVPQDVIFPFAGLNSAIPSGFVRETSLDGKYPKAAPDGDDPNVTGGNSTHTHTSPAHTHDIVDHTHSYTTTYASRLENEQSGIPNGGETHQDHRHVGTSGSAVNGQLSGALTYGAVSNDPPYVTVIFIKSLGTHLPPEKILALWAEDDIPDGWQNSDGTNGTLDVRNKYLKGADSGADAGGTGGSTTNSHDISHGHTGVAHQHVSATSGEAGSTGVQASGGSQTSQNNHTHQVSLFDGVQSVNTYSGNAGDLETVEPAHKKLMALHNISAVNLEKKMIAMWLRPLDEIPAGWKLCNGENGTPDMRDKFLKIATDDTQIGNTGGSNTHTHASQSHSHTSSGSHSHSGSVSAHGGNYNSGSGADAVHNTAQNHTLDFVSTVTATYGIGYSTADSSDNQPPYRTVAYIQFVKKAGAKFLYNFFN